MEQNCKLENDCILEKMPKLADFYRKKILREFSAISFFVIGFWFVFFLILFLLLYFWKKQPWYDATSTISLIMIAISILATVMRAGFFSTYALTYNNWKIQSNNAKLKKAGSNQFDKKMDLQDLSKKRSKKTLIPILLGYIVGIILLAISLPFIYR